MSAWYWQCLDCGVTGAFHPTDDTALTRMSQHWEERGCMQDGALTQLADLSQTPAGVSIAGPTATATTPAGQEPNE